MSQATKVGSYSSDLDREVFCVTFYIAGHGQVVLFWPRDRIDFEDRSRGSRQVAIKSRRGRLWYPLRITSRSLPLVHQGILAIEGAYAKQADGAISAMEGFAFVVMLADLQIVLRKVPTTSPRPTAPRGSTRAVSPSSTGAPARGELPRSGPIARSVGAMSRAEHLARKLKLNVNSPTTRQVLNSLDDTVSHFVGQFRKASIHRKLPSEVLDMTVEQTLQHSSRVRKLLTDARFVK